MSRPGPFASRAHLSRKRWLFAPCPAVRALIRARSFRAFANPDLEEPGDGRESHRRVGEDLEPRVSRDGSRAPSSKVQVAEADVDPRRARRYDRGELPGFGSRASVAAVPVARVETQNEVGVAEHVLLVACSEGAATGSSTAVDVVDGCGGLGEPTSAWSPQVRVTRIRR